MIPADNLARQLAWKTLLGPSRTGPSSPGDPDSLKRAFRRRVLACHPDRAAQLGRARAELQAELRAVVRAYELLRETSTQITQEAPPAEVPRRGHAALPRRPLALAQVLCYLGWIPSSTVPAALLWQRSKRPLLGRIAVQLGLLTDGDVRRVLLARQREERFGTCARRMGALSAEQLARALEEQRLRQPRLGGYFVEAGMITEAQLGEALALLQRHNAGLRSSAGRA